MWLFQNFMVVFMNKLTVARIFSGISPVTGISAATFIFSNNWCNSNTNSQVFTIQVGSTVNCVVLQANLAVTLTALQATGCRPVRFDDRSKYCFEHFWCCSRF
jgi:hypothetical protein